MMAVLYLNQFTFYTIYMNSIMLGLGGTLYMPSIFFVILFLVTMRWIEIQGVYRSTLFAITMQLFALLFSQIGGNFGVLGGQILNGVAVPFLYNSFMKISSSWFCI